MQDYRLQKEVLRGVSRSFYLTIRVLPSSMRNPVAVAYLLARAADTIADTEALPPSERISRLHAFRGLLLDNPGGIGENGYWEITGLKPQNVSPYESELLRRIGDIFGQLNSLPEDDKRAVRRVVSTLTEGMQLDLTTFPPEDSGRLAALESPGQLDHYTYMVAGCVGEFWTEISVAHNARLRRWNLEEMTELGIRFGKALQLTNVLRDVPRDLRTGRCYLPAPDLSAVGLEPWDLLEPANGARARPVLLDWLAVALAHFDAAEEYLLAIPRRCARLRMAALWPILLGLATLGILVRNNSWLDPAHPSRVSRRWVYGMLARSIPIIPSDKLLRAWIGELRRRVRKTLDEK